MKLCIEQIRTITNGAVKVQEETDGVHFYRFTEEQMLLYKNKNLCFVQILMLQSE